VKSHVRRPGLELPRIAYARCNGRPYRYAYGAGSDGQGGFPDRITKVDVAEGTSLTWSEPGSYPGEPIFVREPGTRAEDDGILLSVVLDPTAATSFLLALRATDLTELARARVPHHIPFSFHGNYFPELPTPPSATPSAPPTPSARPVPGQPGTTPIRRR
jgi:carotenoid cleavage dioxygenase-like enzyme